MNVTRASSGDSESTITSCLAPVDASRAYMRVGILSDVQESLCVNGNPALFIAG